MKNILLSDDEYTFVSTLPKFDLEMLLNQINDYGWQQAKETLAIMREAASASPDAFYKGHIKNGAFS